MKNQILLLIVILCIKRIENVKVKEYDENNLSEVNIYVNAPMVDVLDMQERLKRRRGQKTMIKNMEQKIQLDKQAFQQITSIQNSQIQKLGELVKMNEYYASRKGSHNYQRGQEDKEVEAIKDEDFKVQSQVENMVDPYDYVPIQGHPLVSSLQQRLTYDVNNYDQVVDQIYN